MINGNDIKKVLFIIVPSIKIGGTENVVSYLCQNIDVSKFEINLIVLDKIYYDLYLPNIDVVHFNKKSVFTAIPSLISYFRKQNSNALLFSFFDHLNIVLCVLRYFKILKINKLILRSSTILSKSYKFDNNFFLYLLAKNFYKKCDVLICQSVEMSQDFIKNFDVQKEKIHLIYNPFMLKNFTFNYKNSPEFNIFNSSKVKFLAVGNFRKEKGYFRMIDSFDFVCKVVKEAKLFIIGDGPLFLEIEEYIRIKNLQNSVFLFGKVENPNYFFANSNVLLFTSYFEGYPNTLIEANYFKLPIVAYNDCSVLKEIIIPHKNGFIAETDSIEDFVKFSIEALSFNFDDKTFSILNNRHNPNFFISQIQSLLLNE
jgi:glycosyltransferase involved in cell wall biosynthesis